MASRVIKGTDHSRTSLPPASGVAVPRPVTLHSGNTDSLRADQIVQKAQEEFRAMMERAEEEAGQLVAEARARGEEEGRQSAVEYEALARNVEQQLSTGLDKDALEAAVEATRKIVAAEMKARPNAIVDVVKRALGNARHQREIYIRVHPSDAAVLRQNKRELLDALSRARDLDIREDPLLQPGGCMVETEIGMVDADLNTQLDRLCRMLLGKGG
jgi:type III secretion protein L